MSAPQISQYTTTPNRATGRATYSADADTRDAEQNSRIVEANEQADWMNDQVAIVLGGARFASIAEAAGFEGLGDGKYYTVSSAFNGEPETFLYDADSTATADGALIVDATGMGAGRLVSTRTVLADFAELEADVRTLAVGTVIVSESGQYEVAPADATEHDETRADGTKLYNLNAYTERNALRIAAMSDGETALMDGYRYTADSSATGAESSTNDLGVNGVVRVERWHPRNYGGMTRTDPFTLDDGETVRGDSSRLTLITNASSTSIIDLPGNAGSSKDIGINIENLGIRTYDYSLGTGYGIDFHNQGYPFLSNVEVRGGLSAAARLRSTVGITSMNTLFGYSQVAMLLDNEGGGVEGNTFSRMFAPAFRISDTGIHHDGNTRGLQMFSPLFEALSAMVTREDEDAWIGNFATYGGWCEATVGGKVAYDETGSNYDVGPLVAERRLDGCNVPVMHGMYWAGNNIHKGSFYPKHINHHFTPSGTKGIALFREQHTDKQFDWSGTVTNWGTMSSYGLLATLPKLGDLESPDEKYYRQGVFNSIGAANHAGIWDGAGGAVTNLFDTDFSQTSYIAPPGTVYWPYGVNLGGTVSVTTGQADPYGGTDAVLIEDGRRGSVDIPEFAGGGKWMTVAIIGAAQAAGDVVQIYINSTGGAEAQAKTIEMEMPDTEWRIYHAHIYLQANAGANYRVGIGATRIDHTTDYSSVDYVSGGGITIARAACFEGADLHPILNYGQSVSTGFRFVQGGVEVLGSAAPVSGKWFVGDRVRYKAPTAGGKMGAVCVTAGSPGTWKEFGAVDA